MGELARRGSSNLPEPATSGLASVTVHASRWYTPPAVGVVGAFALPAIAAHLPIVGHAAGTVESLPLVGTAITVGAGIAAWKYIGKPLRSAAQGKVEKHSLE